MNIGAKIKARRLELGLSQRALAARLGYDDHTTLTRIEAGKVDLSHSRLLQFAEVLSLSPGYLLGLEDDPEGAGALAAIVLKDPRLRGLVENYLGLDEEDQQTLAAVAASLKKKKG